MIRSDPELLAAVGPRVRKSPFFDATVRAGLSAVSTYNHMWLPMSYGDPASEYERLTTGVSMWDVAAQRHIEVSGPDADALVQLVTAVDITRAEPRHAIYAPMVDPTGTLLNDPVLLHWPDDTWRFSIADSDVRLWIDAIRHGRELDTGVRELDTATLAIQGPRSTDVLGGLGFDWFCDLEPSEMRRASLDIDGDTVDLVVSRSGWSNQGGAELFIDDPSQCESIWERVAAAGASYDIGPGAPNATERIENVLLSYGTDTGYQADPIELGLADHLDLDGPEFIGRSALRRIRDDGPRRRLTGAVIDGADIDVLAHPVPFVVDGTEIGQLRAATHSPRFDRNIGLALVGADAVSGATGRVDLPDGERGARLVGLPFDDSSGD
ncbi:MAG: glycine cleavage T C-terminal barrel domain-containing protein [Ilumatobacteraceae bacterium]|nr:glycine cleavage T C-terminal barrel domain-containing protein [Ilumatobacteraceae bacterium]